MFRVMVEVMAASCPNVEMRDWECTSCDARNHFVAIASIPRRQPASAMVVDACTSASKIKGSPRSVTVAFQRRPEPRRQSIVDCFAISPDRSEVSPAMGLMRFIVHDRDRIPPGGLEHVHMCGQDDLPWFGRAYFSGNQLIIERNEERLRPRLRPLADRRRRPAADQHRRR